MKPRKWQLALGKPKEIPIPLVPEIIVYIMACKRCGKKWNSPKWNANAKSQIQEKEAANKWKKSKQTKKLKAAKHADA